MPTGTATLNFGATGARKATAFVDATTTGLTTDSYLEAFPMAEATADHVKDVSRIDALDLCCEYLSATTFRIHATVRRGRTYGDRKIRWVTA